MKLIIKAFAGLISVTLLISCRKELNVYPTTSAVDGNVIIDTKSAATVLNGVYYRFANAGADFNNVPSILWSDIGETLPSEMAGSIINSSGDDQMSSLTFTSMTTAVPTIWTYAYKLVNAANGFIKNATPVDAIPQAKKSQMLAEAKFLRAYGHVQLLLYYSYYNDLNSPYGVMLRNEFVSADNINLPRATVAASYNAILADLDDAIRDLPAQNSQNAYANASAAKLLKARLLINRGRGDDYAQVIALTDNIINNSPFSLETDQKTLFQTTGFNSKEVIMSVQPYSNETYKFSLNQYYGQFGVSASFTSLLKNDPRSQWLYKNDQGGTIYGQYYGNINEIAKYYSGNTINPVQTPLSENSYAFRLTEAYLLEAEAIVASNGDLTKARSLFKNVLAHAGVTDFSEVDAAATAAALQVLILKEEVKTFFSENGVDWFALRRLPLAVAQTLQPNLKSVSQYILPIPQSELIANNRMIQNPGY